MPTLIFNQERRSPFDKELFLSKDSRLPVLQVQLLDGDTPVNLSSGTVVFNLEEEDGTVKVNNASATLVDGPTGIVKYDWVAADVDTEGLFFGQFVVTLAGVPLRIPNNKDQRLVIRIGPRIN